MQFRHPRTSAVYSKAAPNFFGKNSSAAQPFFKPAIQPKLTVNNPNDIYEQEADKVADQVMQIRNFSVQREPIPISSLQRECAHCEVEDRDMQRKTDDDGETVAGSELESYVSGLSGGGKTLPEEVRSFYEPRFGHDFSKVRVHSDISAEKAARAVNARAFTVGANIVFGAGEYVPESSRGRYLLSHELTHVVQQTGSDEFSKAPSDPLSAGGLRENKAAGNNGRFADTKMPLTANTSVSLQRYHHTSSCTSADLSSVVWPGDHVMRLMVAKAIRVLSASPIDPLVTPLFRKYFMTATPAVATIVGVFNSLQSVITANNYWYECEHDCGADEAAYVRHRLRYIGINPNLHLCINHMSGYSLDCNASLILHEMSHYAAHLDDEATGCGACSTTGCPASLSADDALDNTYSYADFALELYPLSV
jgi:hypothetical protein